MKHSAIAGHNVSRETFERLELYAALLIRWNNTINLVSRRDASHLWERHILDALQLLPLLPDGPGAAIDLGSGGGLPGLVLAIAADRHFNLVESDQRKAAFLREAARECAARCNVYAERIENLNLSPSLIVTARALAPLDRLLALAAPLLLPTGILLAPKGRNAEAELTAAQSHWHMQVTRTPSQSDPAATILSITDLRPVRHDQ